MVGYGRVGYGKNYKISTYWYLHALPVSPFHYYWNYVIPVESFVVSFRYHDYHNYYFLCCTWIPKGLVSTDRTVGMPSFQSFPLFYFPH